MFINNLVFKYNMKIPFLLVGYKKSKNILRYFLGFGRILSRISKGIENDLNESDIGLNKDEYCILSLFNSIIYFVLFFILFFFLSFVFADRNLGNSLIFGLGLGFLLMVIFFFILLKYPKVLAGKKAEEVDKSLLFALKDLLLQVSSGVTLYNSFVNMSYAKYGLVSKEFRIAAQEINSGISMEKSLENMAKRTKSKYLTRSLWQLINSMKVGASLKDALQIVIADLSMEQRARIKDYARELNVWTLMYMLFSVAIPTLGVTMLVVLSGFAGFVITRGTFVLLIVITVFIQIAIIGFIKTRRPVVMV